MHDYYLHFYIYNVAVSINISCQLDAHQPVPCDLAKAFMALDQTDTLTNNLIEGNVSDQIVGELFPSFSSFLCLSMVFILAQ